LFLSRYPRTLLLWGILPVLFAIANERGTNKANTLVKVTTSLLSRLYS